MPKDNGKSTRLIFHLSYPRGTGKYVNANTDENECKVKYPDFDKAIHLCTLAGKNCKNAKSDMTVAFRHLGILKKHWKYLILKAKSPLDGVTYFFIDKDLPFGASISCSHFQRFSSAVAHIVRCMTGHDNVNYLDDYSFVVLLKLICNNQMQVFLDVCHQICFPVSIEKTFWANTCMVFLGLLIDTVNQCVSIPTD